MMKRFRLGAACLLIAACGISNGPAGADPLPPSLPSPPFTATLSNNVPLVFGMANTTSAKKATRKIARRTAVNKSRRTQMRGSVRLVEEAIASGDREAALKAFAAAEPELMQAAQRNIVHRNSASRKVSRLSHRIAKLAK